MTHVKPGKALLLQCEPVHGYGFRRGGYQCRCRPGFRRPRIVRNPYHGELIERATEHDYPHGLSLREDWL
ncbi:hypothetical protein HPB51_023367 [Rhipicephalus microplus]|uniref:GPR158/179 extracellular domain-containing protein n=1 Tax=Rhipicephalus microplus TaxID=6941 RepID=A0A9J6DJP9_RHIMP|nr:hypothetical protein HPB51_023367 [Rhipicephalus microplus]